MFLFCAGKAQRSKKHLSCFIERKGSMIVYLLMVVLIPVSGGSPPCERVYYVFDNEFACKSLRDDMVKVSIFDDTQLVCKQFKVRK